MKLKKVVIFCFMIVFIGGISFIGLVGNFVFNSSVNLVSNEETAIKRKIQLDKMGINYDKFYSKYNVNSISITSSLDGHLIPADYIFLEDNKNVIILVHGLGSNRLSTYPVASLFLDNGYNVIAYDQRSSGENYAKYNTFGVLESRDLSDYVKYARQNMYKDSKLGVWGVSFGGATTGIYLGSKEANKLIDFAILDSPLSSMRYMIETGVHELGLSLPPKFMTFCGNIVTNLRLGFSYNDAEVKNIVRNTTVPVLVINSKADKLTPYFMGKDIFDAINNDEKKIYTVDDSEHASILGTHPKEYEKNVMDFIKGATK